MVKRMIELKKDDDNGGESNIFGPDIKRGSVEQTSMIYSETMDMQIMSERIAFSPDKVKEQLVKGKQTSVNLNEIKGH